MGICWTKLPGYTELVREGMRGVDPKYCVLGPELAEISSTEARKAVR
jgi:hypothetical protein